MELSPGLPGRYLCIKPQRKVVAVVWALAEIQDGQEDLCLHSLAVAAGAVGQRMPAGCGQRLWGNHQGRSLAIIRQAHSAMPGD